MIIKYKFRYDFITRASAEFAHRINQSLKIGYIKWESSKVTVPSRFIFTFITSESKVHFKFLEIRLFNKHLEVSFGQEETKVFDTSDEVVSYLTNLRVSEKLAKRLDTYSLFEIHEL